MKAPSNSSNKFIVIKTKECVYISSNVENKTWGSFDLSGYIFDGKTPLPTFKNDWFQIENIPTVVEILRPSTYTNVRWELKEGFPITEKTPKTIISDDGFPEEYEEFQSLYEYKYDLSEPYYETIEFETVVIAEKDDFKIIKTDYDLKYNLLDELNTPPVMLSTKPCKLSSVDSYNIIRQYIKENIDNKVARITSDYDFCLTVKKLIPLAVPEKYKVDVNFELFSKRHKKPKYEVRYRNNRELDIFETAPDRPREGVYQGYTRTKEFQGKNYEDLINNIETYLKNLIETINKELVECACCQGRGVIEQKEN